VGSAMADRISFDFGQGIRSSSGVWYKSLQLLGTGGTAATFLVLATSGANRGVPFALKVFRRLSKPERRDTFLQEIDFLRGRQHPCIMRIFDSGVFRDDHPFVVAEYLPRTLLDVIRDGVGTLEKTSYALQLLSALDYLASLDPPVVHRDIKPQNIFVKGRSCVLGDFGLMKHVATSDDQDREIVKESIGAGMPFYYRTPDLVSYLRGDAPITTKSDVFQLGLVLAHLFTGQNPEKKAAAFTDEVEIEPLAPFSGSRGITNLITRMLEVVPDTRESAAQLIAPWQGVFMGAAKRAHASKRRVF